MGSGEHSIDLPCYEIRRVRYRVRPNANVPLFDELGSLWHEDKMPSRRVQNQGA